MAFMSSFTSTTFWTYSIDNTCISANWITVYRVIYRTVTNTVIMHATDNSFKSC